MTEERTVPDVSVVKAELEQQCEVRGRQLHELDQDTAAAIASGDESRIQVTRMLTVAAKGALAEVEAALVRLQDGSFGFCGRCLEQIPHERLEILPTSRLCIRCQQLSEAGR